MPEIIDMRDAASTVDIFNGYGCSSGLVSTSVGLLMYLIQGVPKKVTLLIRILSNADRKQNVQNM